MARRTDKRAKRRPKGKEARPRRAESTLRIIGGTLRGRRLRYSGLARTRPMKDRVREAVFNLLGDDVRGKHALDLFAGTGALGLEALSRGACRATFIERHFPTAEIIRQNIASLGLEAQAHLVAGDTFLWARQPTGLGKEPWLVFISPPYALYHERAADMLELVRGLVDRAPPGSVVVVEADEKFDFGKLPKAEHWTVRAYPPAVIGIYRR